MPPNRHLRSAARGAVVAAVLLAAACGKRPPTAPSDGPLILATETSTAVTTRLDRADIVGGEVRGDQLRLQVRFGGGCARHDFALLHSGVFLESLPVQTHLQLAHDAHGDMCRALLSRELTFDLTPLKQAYRHTYRTGRGTLILHLEAPGGGATIRPLRYEF